MLATLLIGAENALARRITVVVRRTISVRTALAIGPVRPAIVCTSTGRKVHVRFDIDLASSIPAVAAVVWTTFGRLKAAVAERLPFTASTFLADAVAAMGVKGPVGRSMCYLAAKTCSSTASNCSSAGAPETLCTTLTRPSACLVPTKKVGVPVTSSFRASAASCRTFSLA